jgi:hypothetical protein
LRFKELIKSNQGNHQETTEKGAAGRVGLMRFEIDIAQNIRKGEAGPNKFLLFEG